MIIQLWAMPYNLRTRTNRMAWSGIWHHYHSAKLAATESGGWLASHSVQAEES